MPPVLSGQQQAVLAFIREFFAENDQLPPLETLRQHFGWGSNRTSMAAYEALHAKGVVERNVMGRYRFVREKAT